MTALYNQIGEASMSVKVREVDDHYDADIIGWQIRAIEPGI
jgi:hypothetical protein